MAVLLRDQFDLELQAHKDSFAALRQQFRLHSFIALWGKRLALRPGRQWSLVETEALTLDEDALFVSLDPHLAVIRDGFALPSAAEEQLDLFTLPTVYSKTRSTRAGKSVGARQRRVA